MQSYNRYSILYIFFSVLTMARAQVSNKNLSYLPTLEECGRIQLEQYGYRGPIQPDEFPWMGRILFDARKMENNTSNLQHSHHCIAVLINHRYMLTVAHCVDDPLDAYSVLLGYIYLTPDKAKSSQQVAIKEIVIHPYYNQFEVNNDIALLGLNETIRYTNYIRPICLPDYKIKYKDFDGAQLLVVGWYRRLFREDSNRDIHKIPVIIENQKEWCKKTNYNNFYNSKICTRDCFQRSNFMSGAALLDIIGDAWEPTNYYLVGLASADIGICPMQKSIYTRVDYYMDWIIDNVYDG